MTESGRADRFRILFACAKRRVDETWFVSRNPSDATYGGKKCAHFTGESPLGEGTRRRNEEGRAFDLDPPSYPMWLKDVVIKIAEEERTDRTSSR